MTIATTRTLLTPYTETLEADFVILNCNAINRAQMNGAHSVSSAKKLFQTVLNDPSLYAMAVLDNKTRDYLGHVFLQHSDDGLAELGFIFDRSHWGKGIGFEALKAFLSKACWELSLMEVYATVNVGHQPSIRILEKLGFKQGAVKSDIHGPYYEYRFTSDAVVSETA